VFDVMLMRLTALFGFISALTVAIVDESNFADPTEIHNTRHIKQHLKNNGKTHSISKEKERLYYFLMHDLNNDSFIDGNEILRSLTHSHTGFDRPMGSEDSMIKTIDDLMGKMDLNGDGYIDYLEFLKHERKAAHSTAQ
ncbi:hypothetical protein V3C99_016173, partial [Haemonchus contortus]